MGLRQVNIRLDTDLVERLKAVADREELSFNQLLQRVLAASVKEYEEAVPVSERLRQLELRMAEVERRLG